MSDEINPPGLGLRLLEGRAGVEAAQVMMSLPVLRMQAIRGEGQTVWVLPGFMADDTSTILLRQYLGSIGYRPHPWQQGINRRPLLDLLPILAERLQELAANGPVRIVGWSRGGILGRELARDHPELVDRVVTIGSPVKGGARVSSISNLVRAQTGLTSADMSRILRERQRNPITRPVRAIYSRTDGVVAWRACIDDMNPDVEHHEVRASHSGMGASVEVFRLLPKLLAEPIEHKQGET